MTTNPNVSRGSFGSLGFPAADFSKCQAFHQCHHQCHHSYHQGRRRKHHGERSVAVELFLFGFRQHPGYFFGSEKKIRKLVVEVGGWNEGSVGCFDFFGFDCFCFFLVMIFKCWSKLLASSLSYIKHNMQETPGTWTNRYPSKREALSNTHFFQRALHPLNFRKGTIISNSKKVEKISYFISEPSKCFPDLLATVLTPGSFNVGCCLFSPFQKKGLYFGVAMGFATKNKQHEKKKKSWYEQPSSGFFGGESSDHQKPQGDILFSCFGLWRALCFHGFWDPKK